MDEYLAVLDDAAFGAATEVPPKFVSPTDPAARWTAAAAGPACYAYCDNHLIDVEHAVIVDVEATTAVRQAEVGAAQTMLTRTAETFGLWPERLIADTGYGSAAMLGWLVHEQGIEPHIPVFDKSERKDGTFSRSNFTYDYKRDLYICPAGKELLHYQRQFARPRLGVDADGLMRYRATKHDCGACALKPRCCPNRPARKILRSIHEGARDMARHRQDRGLRGLKAATKEGRDAIRPPQAHPRSGPPATAGPERCPRRVPFGGDGPKPPQAGQADPATNASARWLNAGGGNLHLLRSRDLDTASPNNAFFNKIHPSRR